MRLCACFVTSTRPASRRTFRCCEIAEALLAKTPLMSLADSSPRWASKSTMVKRVGSASAEKTVAGLMVTVPNYSEYLIKSTLKDSHSGLTTSGHRVHPRRRGPHRSVSGDRAANTWNHGAPNFSKISPLARRRSERNVLVRSRMSGPAYDLPHMPLRPVHPNRYG